MRARISRSAVALAALTVTFAAAAAAATQVAPRNTAPPEITGTERATRTLTVSNGTWEGNPTSFAYQWQRCNADGASCVNITGATSRTYTLTAADVDRTVRASVVASNPDGGTTAFSRPTGIISANAAPRNSARPTITGTPAPGNELTANNGTWTGGVRTYTYQWQRCDTAGANCAAIVGATGRTYGVRTVDVGSTIRVEVTGRNLAGATTVTSDRTGLVEAATTPPPPPPPAPPAGACSNRINGTMDNDRLSGTGGGDNIRSGLGNDVVSGFNGADCIDGGFDNDRLFGGNGNDRVLGGGDNDLADGGPGNDTVSGGNGNDRVVGGSGNDTLLGYLGADRLTGGSGVDRINGGPQNDVIFARDDTRDVVNCGTGRDTVNADPFDRVSQCERVIRR
jgi:Ca2+-binding RTX toxin-like protein